MLNIGFGEIMVATLLLLVFVGPERLPSVLRWAGRNYARLRRATFELQQAFMDEGDLLDLGGASKPKPAPWHKAPGSTGGAAARRAAKAAAETETETEAEAEADQGEADAPKSAAPQDPEEPVSDD